MARKGQTALEYLLIVVVAMSVILVVFVWSQYFSKQVNSTAGDEISGVACAFTKCGNNSNDPACQIPACGGALGVCNTTLHKCQPP